MVSNIVKKKLIISYYVSTPHPAPPPPPPPQTHIYIYTPTTLSLETQYETVWHKYEQIVSMKFKLWGYFQFFDNFLTPLKLMTGF